jgi:hypothetical protein
LWQDIRGRQFLRYYIFVLDVQDTTESNTQHTKNSIMGLQNMFTINSYVACVGRFQCKLAEVERCKPTVLKKRFFAKQLKTTGFDAANIAASKKKKFRVKKESEKSFCIIS